MTAADGFALPEALDPGDHIVATYWMRLAPGADIERAARGLAEMQSTGTWVALSGETELIRARHAARILACWQVPDHEVDEPGGGDPGDWIVRIAYPAHNIGRQIPLLLATTLGEGASTGPLRLLDLELPRSFTDGFGGPRFGIEGLRSLLAVQGRPLLVTMMKPALGLTPRESGLIFRELALGGVDAVKDDELLVEHPWSSIVERVRAHEAAARSVFEVTGHRTISFANITDRPDRMVAHAHRAIEAGASGLMVDLVAIGTSAAAMLAEDPAIGVPVLGHLAFSGAIYGSPTSGMASHLVLGKLPRLAGVDLMVYPGPYGSLSLSRTKHLRIARALTGALPGIRTTLPVPGGGLHAGMVPQLLTDLGPDHAIGAGGAVHGHPMGAAAGARAIRQAIDASVAGEPLAEAAARHPELAASLQRWPEPDVRR
jgi:2,3-diketo-5-methylthiopentyl-1-phosphate enolase